MSRMRTKTPPPPVGELSLTIYDAATWDDARMAASEWQIDLGLYVEYALRLYKRRGEGRKRFARWRHEQDMKDPDMKLIYEMAHEGEAAPEYMDPKYLSKRKR
jgi:hypothetical protein